MIYLDYQATTPLAPEARAAMLPWLDRFGNPHSPHRLGREAAAAVEVARDQVARAIGEKDGRLVFTSGATEAANWALSSAVRGSRRKLVTVATEHACILDTAGRLAGQGVECVTLPVDEAGLVDLDAAAAAIDDRTALVAAMSVNNEIGVIQPIATLAELAHRAGALFFCDAVQGFGRVQVPTQSCDMIAISAHKIFGPKGIGALWVRDHDTIAPLLHGGGQQFGLRSGTLSPLLCAGFGAAAALASERFAVDGVHVSALQAAALRHFGPEWTINGSLDRRYPGNLNLRREGVDSSRLISDVRDVAFSAGSACASGSGRPSHVLRALGLSDAQARASIRLGFGRYTTADEIIRAAHLINEAAARQTAWI